MFLTDTHCHLDLFSFDADRELVIGRALIAGLNRMLNPGIDVETSIAALKLADEFPEVYVAVGVHPNSALSWNDKTYQILEDLAHHPKVVAIGEIGLDYYRNGAPGDIQRRVFQSQLELAVSLNLPVIIHNRNASGDMQAILNAWIDKYLISDSRLVKQPGVLHSFSGDVIEANWALERKFYIGITGPVTYKSAKQVQDVARGIPLSKLLIETDSPYQPPHPHRGERNEPAHVARIAGKIAALREISVEEVARVTSENAVRLFGWRKID